MIVIDPYSGDILDAVLEEFPPEEEEEDEEEEDEEEEDSETTSQEQQNPSLTPEKAREAYIQLIRSI